MAVDQTTKNFCVMLIFDNLDDISEKLVQVSSEMEGMKEKLDSHFQTKGEEIKGQEDIVEKLAEMRTDMKKLGKTASKESKVQDDINVKLEQMRTEMERMREELDTVFRATTAEIKEEGQLQTENFSAKLDQIKQEVEDIKEKLDSNFKATGKEIKGQDDTSEKLEEMTTEMESMREKLHVRFRVAAEETKDESQFQEVKTRMKAKIRKIFPKIRKKSKTRTIGDISEKLEQMRTEIESIREKLDVRFRATTEETKEESQLREDQSRLKAAIQRMKDNIKTGTEKPTDLQQPFRPNPGEGPEARDLKIDQIYVNVVIHEGRADYDFPTDRSEQLKVYPQLNTNKAMSVRPQDVIDADCKNVLVVGRPGIGKTMMSTKLLRTWASDDAKMQAQFEVAFLLKFRHLNKETDLSLHDLLARSDMVKSLDGEVWKYIEENPTKVLLIFDGIDEFFARSAIANDDSSYKNTVEEKMPLHTLYAKLASGTLLPGATVITTTRPTAVKWIRHLTFHRTIELLGFTSEQVEEYVEKFTEDDHNEDAKETIWQHIHSNLNIFSLCYIPVNCFIICHCLLQLINICTDTTRKLPTKITDIYSMNVKIFFFKRNREDKYSRSTTDLGTYIYRTFDDLQPENELVFKKLGKIAFNGIKEGRLIFESSEVRGLEDCGLLHRLADAKPRKLSEPRKAQFCFTHLTVQEFFAAKHLTDTMNKKGLRRFIADHINHGAWQVVMQFVAGLLEPDADQEMSNVDLLAYLALRDRDSAVDLIPSEIKARGRRAQLAYETALRAGEVVKVYRARIMLIGQDRAGKTSLKKSFLGQPFDPNEQSTDGIEVVPSMFEIDIDQVKNWRPTEKKLEVSQFVNDLAMMVAGKLKEEAENPIPEVENKPEKPIISEQNQVRIGEETTLTARKVLTAREVLSAEEVLADRDTEEILTAVEDEGIGHNAARDSVIPELNIDPALPPEEFTQLVIQYLEGLNLQRDTSSVENHMTLDLWDFAGQHLYYASYPVFLSSRAIYMLVYNLSKELKNTAEPRVRLKDTDTDTPLKNPIGETNLENLMSWLVSVRTVYLESTTGEKRLPYLRPPVFIVGTHADKPCKDITETEKEIQTELSGKELDRHVIRPYFPIDNTQGSFSDGMRTLQQKLIEVLKQEPYMGEKVPARWFNFEKVVQALVAKEIYCCHREQLRGIIQKVCFINNDREVSSMLDFYHDLGIIVMHRRTVVLKAEWLIDIFRQIITIPRYNDMDPVHSRLWKDMENEGVLSNELVDHVFSKFCQQGVVKEDILRMMEKFGLIVKFDSPQNGLQYFVPAQLNTPPEPLCDMEPSSLDPCPLYILFEGGFVPHGLYLQLVSQCTRWCSKSGFKAPPKFFDGASCFFIGKEVLFYLILFCKKRFIKVVLMQPKNAEASLAESQVQETASLVRVFLEHTLQRKLSRNRRLPWLNNFKYELCLECPYCPREANTRVHGTVCCTNEDCMCLLEVPEVGKPVFCRKNPFREIKSLPNLKKWFSFKGASVDDRQASDPPKKKESFSPPKKPRGIYTVKASQNLQAMKRVASNATSSITDIPGKLNKIFSDRGFAVSDNEGSGNCLFHALSEQLNLVKGVKISHKELRLQIVHYLEKNPTLLNGTKLFSFVDGYSSWADYLTKMATVGTWGDHVVVHAAASLYKTSILVISSLSHNQNLTITPELDIESIDQLVLGHVHELHYVSLLRKPFKEGSPSQDELENLSLSLSRTWLYLGRRLDFKEEELEEFDHAEKALRDKAYKMLMRWKQKKSSAATYAVLYEALCHPCVNRSDLAVKHCGKAQV